MNNIIETYNAALQAIYDHVGLVEDWVVCPIDDKTSQFWRINDDDAIGYAPTKEAIESEDDDYCEDQIYKQRFYKKWIYEGKEFTLVFCDPQIDGMKWWRLFDNNKRIE